MRCFCTTVSCLPTIRISAAPVFNFLHYFFPSKGIYLKITIIIPSTESHSKASVCHKLINNSTTPAVDNNSRVRHYNNTMRTTSRNITYQVTYQGAAAPDPPENHMTRNAVRLAATILPHKYFGARTEICLSPSILADGFYCCVYFTVFQTSAQLQ